MESSLNKISINFEFNSEIKSSETILNNINVEHLIRGIEVSENVSIIAQIEIIRNKLMLLQQKIGASNNVVMDGRDIGTNIFPDAGLKFFLTAKAEIRAKRRFDEMILNGEEVTFDEVLLNLKKRDKQDTNRKITPLKKAKDAIVIDTSKLSLIQQDEFINKIIQNKITKK